MTNYLLRQFLSKKEIKQFKKQLLRTKGVIIMNTIINLVLGNIVVRKQ